MSTTTDKVPAVVETTEAKDLGLTAEDLAHQNPDVQRALQRLFRCNQLREITGLIKPVMFNQIPRTYGILLWLFSHLYPASPFPAEGRSRRTALLKAPLGIGLVLLLRLAVFRGRPRMTLRGILAGLDKVLFTFRVPAQQMTGYVNSTDREEFLIRSCLLLRALGRYGVCIELLTRRLNSGLPTDETREWLAFFLREIGDSTTADLLFLNPGRPQPILSENGRAAQPLADANGTRLKYGVIVATMFDSDVFRGSLLSLVNSDFTGEVVVVEEGHRAERVCESFCEPLPVKYVKCQEWIGVSEVVNQGVAALDPETEIVIVVHSDVLWPGEWFEQLSGAWDKVYDLDQVELINLGFSDINRGAETTLVESFIRGKYDDLHSVLEKIRDVDGLVGTVRNAQVRDKRLTFGLAKDVWNDKAAQLRTFTGGISVGTSFLRSTWQELGGFDQKIAYGWDMELLIHAFRNRKWGLWLNNSPLIHLASSDTSRLNPYERTQFRKIAEETHNNFMKKYKWHPYHLLHIYGAETSVIYHDDIVSAVNDLRFDDIDFVFDDLYERLETKKLSNCEITWCAGRANCQYV